MTKQVLFRIQQEGLLGLNVYFKPSSHISQKYPIIMRVIHDEDLGLLKELKERLVKSFVMSAALMDLSKAFDCIPHDLIILKLAAYGIDRENLKMTYFYLKGWKKCVKTAPKEKARWL